MPLETIAAKIQRLIAKADSSTHPEEADTFMSKAQQMMEQHGLSLLDLGRLDAEDPVGLTRDKDSLRNNSSANWRFRLAGQLAKYYGCELVGSQRGSFNYWTVFGRESARVTFSLMWPFVDRQVLAVAREEFRKGHYPSTKHAHKAIGDALTLRVYNMNKELRTTRPAETGVNALVPVDLIQHAMAEEYPHLRSSRGQRLNVTSTARDAAGRVSLNVQTGRAPASRRIAG